MPELKEEDEGNKRANVTFSHDPIGWTNGNVEVTIDTTEKGYTLQYNTGDRNREEDWKNYDIPVVMTENGSIYARLKDNANNKGEAIEHKITNIERVKPTIQIQANTTAISQTKQITITAEDTGGSELLDANYYQYYLSTSGAELLGGSWQNYTSGTAFTIGNGMTGTRYIWVKQIADNAGNKSETNNGSYHVSSAYVFDNTAPTLTITTDVNNPTNASSVTYTFTFSEPVTGFTKEDITATNGTKGTFTTKSTSRYTLVVTNTRDCSQTISVAAEKCTDIAGNGNKAASKEITIDRSVPTCTITANVESPTTASSITYTFEWSEMLPNYAFTVEDITVTNGIKGRFLEASKTNTKWTLEVTNTESCNQTVSIEAGVVKDGAGNGNVATSKTVVIDRTGPIISMNPLESHTYTKTKNVTVTISDDAGIASGAYVSYGWSTSSTKEPSSWIRATLNYTTGAKSTAFTATGSGLTGVYYLWVQPLMLYDILENRNSETVSSFQLGSASSCFYFDNTAPKIEISPNLDTTYSKTKSVTVAIEDVDTGIASGASIQYGWCKKGETAPSWYTTATLNYTPGNRKTTFTVTNSSLTGQYYLWVKPVSLKDVAGNSNTTIKSSGLFYFDNTPPTIGKVEGEDPSGLEQIKQSTGTVQIVKGNTGRIRLSEITDNIGGSAGIAAICITESKIPTTWTLLHQTEFTGYEFTVNKAGIYHMWVKDVAGNISATKICTVEVLDAVAQVESVYYARIQDAIDSISSTGTVKVLVNNRKEDPQIPAGKNITLNLSSYTLDGKITNLGTLWLRNGNVCPSDTSKGAILNGSKLYLRKMGEVSSYQGAIVCSNGAFLDIEGGTIQSTGSSGIFLVGSGTVYLGDPEKDGSGNYVNNTTIIGQGDYVDGSGKDYDFGLIGTYEGNFDITMFGPTIIKATSSPYWAVYNGMNMKWYGDPSLLHVSGKVWGAGINWQ